MSLLAYILTVLVLALALDLGLILRVRRDLKRWGLDRTQAGRAVFVFGRYSALLTWLKYCLANWRSARLTARRTSTPEENAPAGQPAIPTSSRQVWWEWLVIFFAVLLFCSAFLDLRAATRLPGNEAELFQTFDWILVNSLKQGQFPLWNPYVFTGLPYVADPMLHIYNPVVTLPVLLVGVNAGFKLALFFSFLLAAYGMWRLGVIIGLGRPARLWIALMVAFAGQPVARFFQGEYLFILAFAWLPWIISSLMLVARTGRRRHTAETILFLALFFFCGNFYYQFFMLGVLVLFFLVFVFRIQAKKPFILLDLKFLRNFSLIAGLSAGLIAIQLFPLIELWPRLSKDMHLEGGHTLQQIFLDYTSKDTYRPDAFSEYPAREEFYAYIGLTPFFALALLPLAFNKQKQDKRNLAFWLSVLAFVILWICIESFPWFDFFIRTRVLLQFRVLLRILVFGSLAIIVLAGIGLDYVWRALQRRLARFTPLPETAPWRAKAAYTLSYAGLVAVASFMLYGVIDLYSTHRPFMQTTPVYRPAYAAVNWLRQHDLSAYYVRPQANNSWYEPVISAGMRYIDMWYPHADIRSLDGASNRRYIQAQPNYFFMAESSPETGFPDMQWIAGVQGYNIYRLPHSLPVAFQIADAELAAGEDGRWLQAEDVLPLQPYFPGPNSIEIIFAGSGPSGSQATGNTLVVLVTQYPGWRLRVDGQPREMKNISGYLAAEVLPGVHRYEFSFRPASFFAGLLVSLFALGITLFMLVSDLHISRQSIRENLRQAGEVIQGWRALPGRWLRQPELLVAAVIRQGVLVPDQPLPLPEDSRVTLLVDAQPAAAPTLPDAARRWVWATGLLLKTFAAALSFEMILFSAAILIYLSTRLVGLTQYPIYFFTDEAVQTLLASDLVRSGFVGSDGVFLPTYFRNVDHFNLSTSVYAQVIPYLLFGKSVLVTRLTSVLLALMAALFVGLIIRDIFKLPHWWSATLLLSITPAWFLHSRTAFEVVLMVSFYVAAVYYYLLYRVRSPRYLNAALVLFALAFYSYSPGQVVVVLTGLALLFSDLGYHWQNRAIGFRGLGLLALLVLPYIRFRFDHPTAVEEHLINLNSYWIQPIPLSEKLSFFWKEYRLGLNPAYWFFPYGRDLERHLMKGYGHLLAATLPFVALGVLVCLKEFRSSAHRLLLLVLLIAPTGAAMAQIAVTRALVMVIPVTLLAAIGLVVCLGWLQKGLAAAGGYFHKSFHLPTRWVALVLFGVLTVVNLSMLRDALVNGPTWYQNYGLMGMQYGARQLYTEVQEFAQNHAGTNLVVSPNWANGPDILAKFFLSGQVPFRLDSIESRMVRYQPWDDQTVFVMIADEYEKAVQSGKFEDIRIELTLPYPNGQPGFYFVRLKYVPDIQAILERERMARRQLQETQFVLDGQMVRARYSLLDIGNFPEAFDGNRHSLIRTMEANPFVIELTFPQPRSLKGISFIIGDARVQVLVRLYTPDSPDPLQFTYDLAGSVPQPQASLELPQEYQVSVLYLEIKDLSQLEPGNVHLWELTLH